MAEWSIAAVLKTVELRGSRGSNPCLSAQRGLILLESDLFFYPYLVFDGENFYARENYLDFYSYHCTLSNLSGMINDMKNIQDTEEYRKIHFAVMAIESGAEKLNISGQEMEDRLQKQDLIRKRLLDQYEMLHTQSLDYVADDIAETLLNWEQSND